MDSLNLDTMSMLIGGAIAVLGMALAAAAGVNSPAGGYVIEMETRLKQHENMNRALLSELAALEILKGMNHDR